MPTKAEFIILFLGSIQLIYYVFSINAAANGLEAFEYPKSDGFFPDETTIHSQFNHDQHLVVRNKRDDSGQLTTTDRPLSTTSRPVHKSNGASKKSKSKQSKQLAKLSKLPATTTSTSTSTTTTTTTTTTSTTEQPRIVPPRIKAADQNGGGSGGDDDDDDHQQQQQHGPTATTDLEADSMDNPYKSTVGSEINPNSLIDETLGLAQQTTSPPALKDAAAAAATAAEPASRAELVNQLVGLDSSGAISAVTNTGQQGVVDNQNNDSGGQMVKVAMVKGKRLRKNRKNKKKGLPADQSAISVDAESMDVAKAASGKKRKGKKTKRRRFSSKKAAKLSSSQLLVAPSSIEEANQINANVSKNQQSNSAANESTGNINAQYNKIGPQVKNDSAAAAANQSTKLEASKEQTGPKAVLSDIDSMELEELEKIEQQAKVNNFQFKRVTLKLLSDVSNFLTANGNKGGEIDWRSSIAHGIGEVLFGLGASKMFDQDLVTKGKKVATSAAAAAATTTTTTTGSPSILNQDNQTKLSNQNKRDKSRKSMEMEYSGDDNDNQSIAAAVGTSRATKVVDQSDAKTATTTTTKKPVDSITTVPPAGAIQIEHNKTVIPVPTNKLQAATTSLPKVATVAPTTTKPPTPTTTTTIKPVITSTTLPTLPPTTTTTTTTTTSTTTKPTVITTPAPLPTTMAPITTTSKPAPPIAVVPSTPALVGMPAPAPPPPVLSYTSADGNGGMAGLPARRPLRRLALIERLKQRLRRNKSLKNKRLLLVRGSRQGRRPGSFVIKQHQQQPGGVKRRIIIKNKRGGKNRRLRKFKIISSSNSDDYPMSPDYQDQTQPDNSPFSDSIDDDAAVGNNDYPGVYSQEEADDAESGADYVDQGEQEQPVVDYDDTAAVVTNTIQPRKQQSVKVLNKQRLNNNNKHQGNIRNNKAAASRKNNRRKPTADSAATEGSRNSFSSVSDLADQNPDQDNYDDINNVDNNSNGDIDNEY